MKLSWFSTEGSPYPLGATWIEDEEAFNFALYSVHATRVTLLLFRDDDVTRPVRQITLDHLRNKSGRVWHCRIPEREMQGAKLYAYQLDGPRRGPGFDRHAFDPEKVLLDPYAKEVYFPESFQREAAIGPGCNMGRAAVGALVKNGASFDWGGDRIDLHEHDLVIYEMHVRGFTRRSNSGLAEDRCGTFLGVIDKIPYLKELGITAVEFMPVMQFDPSEGNYWGYMPLNFFAPHSQYASAPQQAGREFRAMVKALHSADIEVLIDVVFNHTVEGDSRGPCYSFKGIDNSSYYMLSDSDYAEQPYLNYSGTGNTLHTKNRHVVRMILDSMRSWVLQHHVDGFRFDLASVFNRHSDGSVSSDESRLVAAIRADPVLGRVRLIAEPWDAAGLDQLGRAFPGKRWFQWNGKFRDDIRKFVRGDAGLVPAMMRRVYGSDDLFPDSLHEACHPYQSINYVNSHDGFTLYDLVAYNERRNWPNGEQNQDGHRDNFSWNCGWEGDEGVPQAVRELRVRQAKNFCCLLMLSNGTPMFRAGDEFLQTQQGNNNPYNQDNEVSWLDWDLRQSNADFFRFFRLMIAFRKSHPTIARSRFWRDDVEWYGCGSAIDMSQSSGHFAYYLDGFSQGDADLYVMINAEGRDRTFEIQHFDPSGWKLAVDTGCRSPFDIYEESSQPVVRSRELRVRSRSIVVLIRKRQRERSTDLYGEAERF